MQRKRKRKVSRAYNAYRNILKRCLNPKDPGYKHYGGRGIKVCDRWGESFKNFYEDMGDPPDGLSIDRINNDGNYCKENCRWANLKDQARNTGKNVIITYNGETHCAMEWGWQQ